MWFLGRVKRGLSTGRGEENQPRIGWLPSTAVGNGIHVIHISLSAFDFVVNSSARGGSQDRAKLSRETYTGRNIKSEVTANIKAAVAIGDKRRQSTHLAPKSTTLVFTRSLSIRRYV